MLSFYVNKSRTSKSGEWSLTLSLSWCQAWQVTEHDHSLASTTLYCLVTATQLYQRLVSGYVSIKILVTLTKFKICILLQIKFTTAVSDTVHIMTTTTSPWLVVTDQCRWMSAATAVVRHVSSFDSSSWQMSAPCSASEELGLTAKCRQTGQSHLLHRNQKTYSFEDTVLPSFKSSKFERGNDHVTNCFIGQQHNQLCLLFQQNVQVRHFRQSRDKWKL